MSRRANPRLVGAFVIVAVLLAVVGVTAFGSGKLFRDTTTFVLYFDQSLDGLSRGAPVKFMGVEIGQVTDVLFNIGGDTQRRWDEMVLPVLIEIDQKRIRARGAYLADFGTRAFVDTAIAEGLRASLRLESFVTGRQYIQLDVRPGTPVTFRAGPDEPYMELPTIRPGSLDELGRDATEFFASIASIDFAEVVDSVQALISEFRGFAVTSATATAALPRAVEKFSDAMDAYAQLAFELDSTLVPLRGDTRRGLSEATAALTEMRGLLEDLGLLVAPGSPITVRLESALAEMAEAARALRILAEYLEQNPSALVRGNQERKDP